MSVLLRMDRAVREGAVLPWQDLTVRVLDMPGYTRGALPEATNRASRPENERGIRHAD